ARVAAAGVPSDVARRLLLGAQGLLRDPARPIDAAGLQALIEQLGFVQLDSINVVARAHHLTLAARADGYVPEQLAHLLEATRGLFEHWTHDASAIPTAWYRHWHHRFDPAAERIRASAWWGRRIGARADALVAEVLRRIDAEGPLPTQAFERTTRGGEENGWWSWTPEKAALEYLWHTGALAVAKRIHFHKYYDLAERVIPKEHHGARSTQDEHVDWACMTALERLGVATPAELAAFWRAISIAEARRWCEAARREGRVEAHPAGDGSKSPVYSVADWRARADDYPDAPDHIRLLSPFDPILRDRKRTERLFGFDYRFEAFVPAAKRRYGYYVLPILEGHELVGRLEPKNHRDARTLEIRGVWWEPSTKVTAKRRRKLDEAIERLAKFVGAEKIRVERR
ncbi:winged helix DNA-binding domain-containing protein, partial [Myxococcota bacterium]|nr:winged helix DNA-binding domain-containing protein [Myxococcota bacterium]